MRRHRVIDDKKHSITITATELKKNLGKYLDYALDSNEVVITKNGSKAKRLTPYLSDYDRYELMKNREQALDYQYGGIRSLMRNSLKYVRRAISGWSS
jgi:prevent-host-death family protein